MPTPIDRLNQQADTAVSTYEATIRQLHQPDGSRRFSDQVHTSMEAAARTRTLGEISTLVEQADQTLATAQATLGSVQDDPTAHMTADELAAASARFTLVREEGSELSLMDVHQRLQQAANAKDRVSAYLWSRVAQQRLAAIDEAARRASMMNMSDQPNRGAVAPISAVDAVAANKLRGLLPEVRASLVPEAVRNRVAQAQQTVEAAQSFKFKMRQRLEELSGELPKHRATLERDFRSNF